MEPKWLGMDECVIFRTLLRLEFLGRTHYKESFHQDHILSYTFHQDHILSYIWWKTFASFK